MIIKIEHIAKAIEKKLTIEEYIFLRIKEDGCEYLFPTYPEIAFTGNLIMNNLLKTSGITSKGKALLKEIEGKEISKKVDTGINQLYISCQEELIKLVNKKQVTSKINGKSYSFLPNFIDFQDKIEKTCKKYQLNDKEQLKKVLLQYINKCNKENNWFPILEYYISKDNKSKLATDYISYEDKEETEVKIEPKGIKNLF